MTGRGGGHKMAKSIWGATKWEKMDFLIYNMDQRKLRIQLDEENDTLTIVEILMCGL